jgi:hypothetical protein
MDQLRQVLGSLKQHHFWVLVVVATVVALGCWFQGASALYNEFAQNKRTIEAEFVSQSNLRNKPFHANDDINKKQQDEIAKQRERVDALWRQLYERQRADVLKWPSNLREDFHRYVEKLKFGDSIPQDLRNHYNNYVGEHFPELPKIVGALEMEGEGQGQGGSRGGFDGRSMMAGRSARGLGMERDLIGGQLDPNQAGIEEQDYIVEWLDQPRVRDDLYMPSTPTSKRIWVTQEDLWVYEALLGIIARTNEEAGADRYSNAVIRTIYSLEVGRLAAQSSRSQGRIEIGAPAGGDMMRGGDPRSMSMDGGVGYPGTEVDFGGEGGGGYRGDYGEMGGRGGMMGGDAMGDASLFAGRYLNADGSPIVSTGDGGPGEFGTEFKRLPIRMMLEMDQRWLPYLITECANAPLQVEVTEVRINPPGGMEGSSGRSSYRGSGSGSVGAASGKNGEPMFPEREPNMKPVAIQGTIFIFNPPTDNAAAQQLAELQ